ncbi:tetratricopeptide repeat protein [candidate division KSB1 bacterium]|nr:tetratricopeptide repeat protein [candidate division KSB1 bacterium]
MKHIINLFVSGLIIVIFPAITSAVSIDSLICHGIEQSILQNYSEAEDVFTSLISSEPLNPRAYFFKAAVIQSKMMDFESMEWEAEFYKLLDQTEAKAKQLKQQQPENPWSYFYLGSAYSYRAFYEGRAGSYVTAAKHGLAGIKALKKAIEIDSTIYDVYFGLGSYKYWRSKMTRYINWLPLIKDERKQGTEMVKQAASKGRYTRYAAINELTWILIDDGQVSEALSWAKIGLAKYPHSRFFMWGTAKCYFNLQQYNEALIMYEQILESLSQESINNHYNEIICYYKIADCYYHLNDNDSALRYCNYISTIPLTDDIQNKLKEIFEKVKKLQRAVLDSMENQ